MKINDLINLNFIKIELDDDVLKKEIGTAGTVYVLNFPHLNRSITTEVVETSEAISFLLCDLDGNILRRIKGNAIAPVIATATRLNNTADELIRRGQERLDAL